MDGRHTHRWRVVAATIAALPSLLVPALAHAAAATPAASPSAAVASTSSTPASVIVRTSAGALDAVKAAVEALGGKVTLDLAIIDGFAAEVPANELAAVAATPGVTSVTRDATVHMDSVLPTFSPTATDPMQQLGSPYAIASTIHANLMWAQGYTGSGVDVAVLDTGVAPVTGLAGRYVNGPDLSLDAFGPGTAGLDGYGHGTAMASLIAGHDPNLPSDPSTWAAMTTKPFVGMAPGARVVNVKVGASDGATDVSQVIAGINWVVEHAHDGGRNIRVLNLSFGTDGVQNYQLDPLTYAAEVAWRKGIVVVVSAGNYGFGTAKLDDPAYDPYVMAVGASDNSGTLGGGDDEIADFSSRGDASRRPDFMAPGVGVVGLRDPGSTLDTLYPLARQGDRFFRGSGTSQAAAVVSGATALLLQEYPQLTPDQVKAAFTASGKQLRTSSGALLDNGARRVDVSGAAAQVQNVLSGQVPSTQTWPVATGTGSIDAARGSFHLTDAFGNTLAGEVDVFGNAWNPATFSAAAWNGSTWSADSWLGHTWTGALWNGRTWTGDLWSGRSWSGRTWSGSTWSGSTWSGSTWSGSTWSGSTWSGSTWSGSTWSGSTWSGSTWSGSTWSGNDWE